MRQSAVITLFCFALSCAQSGGADAPPADTSDDAAAQEQRPQPSSDAGGRDAGGALDARPQTQDSGQGTASGGIKYQCPLRFSEDCVDGSRCESTCLGQYQSGPTCAYFSQNATRNDVPCTPVSALSGIRSCPSKLSQDCSDATRCESTCVGQFQAAATCSVRGSGGTPTDVPCADAQGKGPAVLYACPDKPSTGCARTSDCQSTCVGQISSLATCTTRAPDGVGTDVNCTALGTQSF